MRERHIPPRPEAPLPAGISECLLGRPVRFDGGHKRSAIPHDEFEGLFEWRAWCPEVAIGMGIPRDPIRLVGDPSAPRAVGVKDASLDVTDALDAYARAEVPGMADLAAFVLMKNSPSCGMERVKVYRADGSGGPPRNEGRGVFAARLLDAHPTLPVEESGRLQDARLRESFVTRAFVRAHFLAFRATGITAAGLVEFHSRYKFLVMAHSVEAYRQLGPLLANLRNVDLDALAERYFTGLMAALARPATRGTHTNVLMHLQGYVSRELDAESRTELTGLVEAYRRGEVPLVVPVTFLAHLLRRFPDEYALNQVYLEPHPRRYGLRNAL